MVKFTNKQNRFVEEFLIDLNGTQAAIRAGYSSKTAYSIGHENLKKPEIQEAIAEAVKARSERTELEQNDVIARLVALSKKAEKAGQFSPAIRAVELLGRHLNLFTDSLNLSGSVTVCHEDALTDALRRAREHESKLEGGDQAES